MFSQHWFKATFSLHKYSKTSTQTHTHTHTPCVRDDDVILLKNRQFEFETLHLQEVLIRADESDVSLLGERKH